MILISSRVSLLLLSILFTGGNGIAEDYFDMEMRECKTNVKLIIIGVRSYLIMRITFVVNFIYRGRNGIAEDYYFDME